jgi:hypothetical protein
MRVFSLRGARMLWIDSSSKQLVGFYVFLVVVLQQLRHMNVIGQFPCVIAFGVSLPFNQIL